MTSGKVYLQFLTKCFILKFLSTVLALLFWLMMLIGVFGQGISLFIFIFFHLPVLVFGVRTLICSHSFLLNSIIGVPCVHSFVARGGAGLELQAKQLKTQILFRKHYSQHCIKSDGCSWGVCFFLSSPPRCNRWVGGAAQEPCQPIPLCCKG